MVSFLALVMLTGGAPEALPLLPMPVSVRVTGGVLDLSRGATVVATAGTEAAAELLAADLTRALGRPVRVTSTLGPDAVVLRLGARGLPREGYRLRVTPDGAVVSGADPAGLYYGTRTLLQLLDRGSVPCVRIDDSPRFRWRGLMLDCSRTFQSLPYLHATVDRMAAYRMNVLHLHLTDDQGWRLEIRAYPELTRKGARFPDEYGEPESTQGFYTQAEMRELVRYAALRGVTIVPEIEMPGHCLAALACYPELSCSGGPFQFAPYHLTRGIQEDVFCPGNDETFRFLEAVLDEAIDVFPSPFIHIGGDEVPKTRWAACPRCQERIRAEGLQSAEELQSYFVWRIERYLDGTGRRLIGWDEILEGGLAPNATVMSWRGVAGGIQAASMGHGVVMSPTSHCYFDYPYTAIDSERAYGFEPIPPELPESERDHVLGLQANFWSHIDRRPELVDRQLYPRLLSIAERGWSPADVRDWSRFEPRLAEHTRRLLAEGVGCYEPPLGRWAPPVSEEYHVLAWELPPDLAETGPLTVEFRYTGGACRLGIEWVELARDGVRVSVDEHRGMTGAVHEGNVYRLELPTIDAGARYELRASVRSEGGTDSSGEVRIVR